jgi:FkbM family methyltransferase
MLDRVPPPPLSYRIRRKSAFHVADVIRGTLNRLNTFRLNPYCRDFKLPVFAATDFTNVFWVPTWKTDVIKRLVSADEGAFIDVGANVGQTVLDVLSSHPTVQYIGFEPNPACVFYLRMLIKLNEFNNCQLIPVGLSDETRCVPFYLSKDADASDTRATVLRDLRPSRSLYFQYIPCFRFDDLYADIGVKNINFIKIDVEGLELETLIGMRASLQKFRPNILCEVLFTDKDGDLSVSKSRNEKLMGLLSQLEFCVLQLVKTENSPQVVDVKRIEEFSSGYWSLENSDQCDYLFVPKEKEHQVLGSLFPSRAITGRNKVDVISGEHDGMI